MRQRTVPLDSWQMFERRIDMYFDHSAEDRRLLIFRGHSNASWPLAATIDRAPLRRLGADREVLLSELLNRFRRECSGLAPGSELPTAPRPWELLARHHGLPSAILDWTYSPYLAAYFAFARRCDECDHVAIWSFDRAFSVRPDVPGSVTRRPLEDPLEIWEEPDDYRLNPRAVEQQAVFMRIHDPDFANNPWMAPCLTKFSIPAAERRRVLAKLRSMKVDDRSLFRTIDSAATSALLSMELE